MTENHLSSVFGLSVTIVQIVMNLSIEVIREERLEVSVVNVNFGQLKEN